jgi:hypothetical protein
VPFSSITDWPVKDKGTQMLTKIHNKKGLQLILGLLMGIAFGFLLQKGGATQYDIILGQLLLTDFTVVKIMMSAVVTGMIGIYFFKSLGLVKLQPKAGSVGMNVVGGLIFGIAFALLGYCPGTAVGAIGSGCMDALFGGLIGMLVGSGLFAAAYPRLSKRVLQKGYFGDITFPELLKINEWIVVAIFSGVIVLILYLLESAGL